MISKYNLTKKECIKALKEGKKVQHRFFLHEEYMFQPDKRVEIYQFEDGVLIESDEFWKVRNDPMWNANWKEFNEGWTILD